MYILIGVVFVIYYSGMILLHVGHLFIIPPIHLPDLFQALFALYGALNLLVAYVYMVYSLWMLPEDEMQQ